MAVPIVLPIPSSELTVEGKPTQAFLELLQQIKDALDDLDTRYRQQVAASDETTIISAATQVLTFRAEAAFNLSEVRASLKAASNSGAVTITVKRNGSTVFSTALTIDVNEKTSTTAATPAVLTSTPLAITDDDEFTVDIDGAGTGALGLKILLLGSIP